MNTMLEKIVEQLQGLPPDKLKEVSQYVQSVVNQGRRASSQNSKSNEDTLRAKTVHEQLDPEAFGKLLDQLAHEMTEARGVDAPPLSDYAISREGIYEEHP